jgi:hypothetical protein
MRIAILFYGRLNKCVEHFSNIIESIGKENDIDIFLSSDNSSQTQLSDFINLYKPILYNNDEIKYDCDFEKYPGKYHVTSIHNMTCHFINKARVYVLLEDYINKTNIKYDVVVSLRIDLVFNNKFDFNNNNLEDNTIYIPSGNDYCGGINDQVAYGSVEVMKKYNSIFLNTFDLLEKGVIPHPESLTSANIDFYKLNVKRFCLNYYIER